MLTKHNSIDDSKTKALLVHPTGNANSRAVLEGMCNHGILGEFHTAVASYPGNTLVDCFRRHLWDVTSRGASFHHRPSG